METKDKLQQTFMDINKKQLEPKGYYVDCVLTDSPSTFVYNLCLTRVSTQQKVLRLNDGDLERAMREVLYKALAQTSSWETFVLLALWNKVCTVH